MQELPQPLLTLRDNLYTFVATILSGGAIGIFIKWLTERKKTSAEVLEIHATRTKLELDAHEVSTRTIIEAQNTIVDLVDINRELQGELIEACRRADNFEFELGQARFQVGQLELQARLDAHTIEQLQAASKLGVKLSDLPTHTHGDD